ncbi:MAG: 2-C-methyl-D-erythritol 4-phosphate cytidylyltransferase [Candidatus Saccharimonadales bacterium]
MKNVAIILAGGVGVRMKLGMPKQFLKIAGRPIIEHTIKTFQDNDNIDDIIIMITPGYVADIKYIKKIYPKVSQILEGGETRNDTTQIAIDSIKGECNVLMHDAVRPFVSDAIISRCIDKLETYKAVDVAIQSADTIIKVNDGIIESIPDRSLLRRGQTPQAFRLSTIKKAYARAKMDGDFRATDDCGVVVKYLPDIPVAVVEGDESNIKVTNPLDASVADKLFQMSTAELSTLTDAVRKKLFANKVVVVFGGGYGIGAEITQIAKQCGAKPYGFSRTTTNTDISNVDDVRKALESVYGHEGGIDYVVNTAGVLTMSSMDDLDIDSINSSILTNYIAPVMIAKLSKPYLKESSGQLLLFTSSSYTRGRANYSLYSSSKAAIVNLTQALAEEWHDEHIRINCINPERTATPMRHSAFGDEDPATLLSATTVAQASIDALLSKHTGQIFDVRRSRVSD